MSNTTTEPLDLNDLVTPNDLSREFPELLNMSRLRYMLRERASNGLDDHGAVLKKGKLIFISRSRFAQWLDSSQDNSAA